MTPSPATLSTEVAAFIEPTLDELDAPAADEYAPAPEPTPPVEAPYGYLKDGVTPRRSPAGRPAKNAPKPARKAAPARARTPRKAAPTLAPPAAPTAPQAPLRGPTAPADAALAARYAGGISQVIGYGQKIVIGSAVGVKARGAEKAATTLLADAAVLGQLNRPLSIVGGQLAAENPDHVAVRVLDKLLVAGPYAEAGFAVLVALGQLAVNHGAIPAGWFPGTKTPQVLADALIAEMEEMAQVA